MAAHTRPCAERAEIDSRTHRSEMVNLGAIYNLFFKYIEVERNTPKITICVDLSNAEILEVRNLEN